METKVIKLDPDNIDLAAITEAGKALDSGGLVAFPTETVYGIGCKAGNDSIAKLNWLKGRPADKYYTLHIARPVDVSQYVPIIGLRAKKLIKNTWPGPLTIVFELDADSIKRQKTKLPHEVFDNLYRDSSIGIRCPDNTIASALLAKTKSEIIAPSANVTGKPPAINASQVIEQLDGKLDIVLDGGPCRHKINSTIVKFGKNGLEILRQGVYSKSQLLELSKVTVLFLCTGNSCRSPMAEGLFSKYLAEKLGCTVDLLEEKGYIIISAGTLGMISFPASPEAVMACAAKGVDISRHRSRALSGYLIEQSELIFAMARIHRDAVLEISPEAADKCLLLGENKDIIDPIGQSQQVYDTCAKVIEKAIQKRINEIVL